MVMFTCEREEWIREEMRVGILLREIRRELIPMQYRTDAPDGRCQKLGDPVESFSGGAG
jgi:hypothetical protein